MFSVIRAVKLWRSTPRWPRCRSSRPTMRALCVFFLLLASFGYCFAERYEAAEADDAFEELELIRRLQNAGVPDDVPENFDCQARYLAYNVSLKMQPSRAPMKEVWDSLQLTTLCNMKFNPHVSAPLSSSQSPRDGLTQEAGDTGDQSPPAVSYRIFVDQKNGDDNSEEPHKPDRPLRNIWRALEHARHFRKQRGGRPNANGKRSADTDMSGAVDDSLPVSIVLRGGVHYLNETLQITVEDSSTILESYTGETAVISGGKLLSPTWKPYNVSGEPRMVVQEGADNVWGLLPGPGKGTDKIKYKGTFPSPDGCQALCKYPECYAWTWHKKDSTGWSQGCYIHSDHWWAPHVSTTDTSGYWSVGPNIYIADVSEQAPANLKLGMFVADSEKDAEAGMLYRANRARYPNIISQERTQYPAGWVSGGTSWQGPADMGNITYITVEKPTNDLNPLFQNFRIGYGGPCSIFDPPESYWCSDQPGGGGASTFRSPSGVTFNKTALHNVPYNATLFQSSAVLHTWRPAHWSSWMFEFGDFDPDTLKGTFSKGGFQGARGSSSGSGWWLSNVFEELDFPNEYFYNPESGSLYYYYNGTGAPPADMQFVAANLKTLVSITGSKDNPVFNFTLKNVVLTAAAYTYMDPHGIPSGGDWALQRSGAVFLEGTKSINIENCLFKNLDGNALFLSGYVHDSVISNNEFTLIGDSAMAAWGYTDLIDGTNQEQPRRTLVDSNFIHELGLYEKQSSCWFQGKSAQTRLTKNICFNGPRAGININDGFGGANVLEDNVLFNLCRESSDHAPFNSWDRQPFLTDVPDPDHPTVYPAVNNITHNFIIGNYGSSMCIDNDDGSSYYHHSYNYLVYGGHKTNFGGHDKLSSNNYNIFPRVYSYTCFGVFQNVINITIADGYENCTCVLRGVSGEHMYFFRPDCDPTKPDTLSFKTSGNTIYSPNATAEVNLCGKTVSSEDWFKMGLDPGSVVKAPPDVDTIIGWGKTLFGIE